MRRRTLALLFPLILSVLSATLYAENTRPEKDILGKEKRLEDVHRHLREEKKIVKDVARKESSILGELEAINKNLITKREELAKIETSLESIRSEADLTGANISRLDTERRRFSERLKLRLRSMYKLKRGESLRIFLSTDTSTEMSRRLKYLTSVMTSDAKLINAFEKSLKALKIEKAKLTRLEGALETAHDASISKKAEAERAQQEKSVILNQARLEKSRRERIVKELEDAALELTSLINKLKSEKDAATDADIADGEGFASLKGRMPRPVDGAIVSHYGKVKHPKFQTVTFNNGILIEAPAGTPVKSVYDGKVIYADWLKGYGQVLIIDHGRGFYTLFAHLSKMLKGLHDTVGKGDEVGLVGDSGAQTSAGLYFEIRQRGVPRDPAAWFAAK